jgi:glycosyltransferase involved in cell wall biosynthesis
MKLLVFTQKVDMKDPVLGFFHSWLLRLSKEAETLSVICLEKGEYDLPNNVSVYSLGKEIGAKKLLYIRNTFKYLRLINGSYDKVFVHMNEEYVLLCGLYWKLKNIPVYLWRNHPNGTFKTFVSVLLSKKVFCTSTESYTARFKKTKIMPAGIDIGLFREVPGVVREKYSIAMVGRISPIKNNHLAIEALSVLIKNGVQASLNFIGPVSNIDQAYFDSLKKYSETIGLKQAVRFIPAVMQTNLPEVYSRYEVILNLTKEGSFDKTIVEAASCRAFPLVSSPSFRNLLPGVCITDPVPENIAFSIKQLLDPTEQIKIQKDLEKFVLSQSLNNLMSKISQEIK